MQRFFASSDKKTATLKNDVYLYSGTYFENYDLIYQRISAEAQVNPLPKAAKQTKSPSLTFPASHASHNAIGIEAAVVFPYFWILFQT